MSIEVSKTSVVVLFDNERYQKNGSHYDVTITVKVLRAENTNKEYYDITYAYKFVPGDATPEDAMKNKQIMHPFHVPNERVDISHSQYGDIVYKNSLTSVMIEYLMMDEDTLSKQASNSSAQRYRQDIMLSLTYFWD